VAMGGMQSVIYHVYGQSELPGGMGQSSHQTL